MADRRSISEGITEREIPGGALVMLRGKVVATRCGVRNLIAVTSPISEVEESTLRLKYKEYMVDVETSRKIAREEQADTLGATKKKRGRGALQSILRSFGR